MKGVPIHRLDTTVYVCVSQLVHLCVRKRKSSGRMTKKKGESCLMLDYGNAGGDTGTGRSCC